MSAAERSRLVSDSKELPNAAALSSEGQRVMPPTVGKQVVRSLSVEGDEIRCRLVLRANLPDRAEYAQRIHLGTFHEPVYSSALAAAVASCLKLGADSGVLIAFTSTLGRELSARVRPAPTNNTTGPVSIKVRRSQVAKHARLSATSAASLASVSNYHANSLHLGSRILPPACQAFHLQMLVPRSSSGHNRFSLLVVTKPVDRSGDLLADRSPASSLPSTLARTVIASALIGLEY